jgi:hypothetical protein
LFCVVNNEQLNHWHNFTSARREYKSPAVCRNSVITGKRKQNIRTANESFENVPKFKYLETTLTNQNVIHVEIKSTLNSRNACYYSVQSVLPYRLCWMGAKLGLPLWGRNIDWGFLRTECWGGYLDLKGRKMDREENCIMRNFIAFILHRILLVWLNKGGWGGRDMWHAWKRCLQGFGWEAQR